MTADDVTRLRDDLAGAGYTVEGVAAALGPLAQQALTRDQPLPAARATAHSTEPPAVLTRAFVLGLPVRRSLLDRALPATGAAGAQSLGLVEASGSSPDDEVRALVDLSPYAATDALGDVDWWIASDLSEVARRGPLPPEHVLGIGGASQMLAQVTVRPEVDRVLDLGTGCGIQALHALRHARSVTATDTSVRALAFARLNAALAGAELDLRNGDMLEPVAGERFDLVVSNPPFVITPREQGVPAYTYRDGGRVGDALVADLVGAVADVLAPGGVAQILGNWEHHPRQSWADRVAGWLEGTGLDAWVVQREVSDPAEYADTWIRDGGQGQGEAFDELATRWLDDFAARGVEAVGFGVVTLRRPVAGAPTLRRIEDRREPLRQPLGPHLLDALRAHDLLAGCDDTALLARRWQVAADVTEERHHRPGEADPVVILLRQGGGFGRVVQASTVVAAAVGACDGELTLGQVTGALAGLLDAGEGEIRAQVLPVVRSLVADGMLLPT